MKAYKQRISGVLAVMMTAFAMTSPLAAFAETTEESILTPSSAFVQANAYDTFATGQYYLKSKSTGNYLTVDGAKAANGQNVSVAAKKESGAFQFAVSGSASAGYYLASAINTAFVVNPYSDTPKNGTNITLYKKVNDGTQQFYFQAVSGGYVLRSIYNTDLALTVNGSNVQLSTYTGADSQIWAAEKIQTSFAAVTPGQYYLKHNATGKYLSVDGASAKNGQNLSVASKSTANAYQFNITGSEVDGYYLCSMLNTGFAVNPYSDTPANGTNITLYKKTSDGTQNWYFEKTSDGYILHNNYNKNLVLSVSGTNAALSSSAGSSAVWSLEPVDSGSSGYTAMTEGYYFLKNSSTGTYLNFSKTANGQAASLSSKSDTNAFKFHLTGNAKNGYLLASALGESYVINPYSDTPGNGTKITLYKKSGDGTQNWFFQKNGSGYILHNGYVQNSVITAGSTVALAANASSAAQTWILEPTSIEQKKPVVDDVATYTAAFKWGQDNWSFSNVNKNFPSGYAVNTTILNKLVAENQVSNDDKKKCKEYAKKNPVWRGSCYGFTMSELLALNSLMTPSSYGLSSPLAGNKATSNATSLINFYQISQTFRINNQKFRRDSFYDYNGSQPEALDRIIEHFKNGGKAVNLCYFMNALDANGKVHDGGGHSVLCYGVTSCKSLNDGKGYYSSITGKYYTCKLLIADPNYLASNSLSDDTCLYFNINDGSWIIPYWNGTQCTVDKKKCTRYCYWNADSKKQYAQITQLYTYDSSALHEELEVNHYLAGISLYETSNEEYLLSAVSDSGNSMYNAGDGVDIAPVSRFAEMEDEEDTLFAEAEVQGNEFALWNPTTNYSLVYDAPESYELSMDYENVAYYADVDNAVYTEFSPEGRLEIMGEDITYDVSIVTEDSLSTTDWYCLSLKGADTNALTIGLGENGYLVTADSLTDITVVAENDDVTTTLTFSTDAQEVLVYEIDANTIGVAIDTNDDGTFDTTIASGDTEPDPTEPDPTEPDPTEPDPTEPDPTEPDPTDPNAPDQPVKPEKLGDLDGNGEVDASDAAAILVEAASLGAGNAGTFSSEQFFAADVNGDGQIDASDAAVILVYAAMVGAGNADVKIEDLV